MKLHHIGVVVKDIQEASADYTNRFGYVVKSGIIHDPVQTAFVQFLKLDEEAIFLELVSPDGPNSKLVNALKKGVNLNHLCYLTDDIYKDCKAFYDKGMYLLQKPVKAVAFPGRHIAWLMARDGIPIELVERGCDQWQTKS